MEIKDIKDPKVRKLAELRMEEYSGEGYTLGFKWASTPERFSFWGAVEEGKDVTHYKCYPHDILDRESPDIMAGLKSERLTDEAVKEYEKSIVHWADKVENMPDWAVSSQEVKAKLEVVDQLAKEYPNLFKEFTAIQQEQLQLFAKKHLDYGFDNISVNGDMSKKKDQQFALSGLWYRVNDKVQRWKNLIGKEKINNESLEDSWLDMGNYSIISLLVSRGKWK